MSMIRWSTKVPGQKHESMTYAIYGSSGFVEIMSARDRDPAGNTLCVRVSPAEWQYILREELARYGTREPKWQRSMRVGMQRLASRADAPLVRERKANLRKFYRRMKASKRRFKREVKRIAAHAVQVKP